MGRSTVNATGDPAPVVFASGAVGNAWETVVSPNHRMWVEGWQAELLFAQEAAPSQIDPKSYAETGGILPDLGKDTEFWARRLRLRLRLRNKSL
ncbi:MAG: hypothetical protein WBC90_06350 [Albidovulum sp.]